jgi:hypothetical protein
MDENEYCCDNPECEVNQLMQQGYSLKKARLMVAAREQECLDRDGWYAHLINGDHSIPTHTNYHTHGLFETYSHLDLQLVIPLDLRTINHVFCEIISRIKEGNVYKDGDIAENVVNNYSVKFVQVTEGDRQVLRIIIPDHRNNFDRDTIEGTLRVQYDDIEEDHFSQQD